MWDNGLAGRFCVDCFDYVVDAEQLLANQLRECPMSKGANRFPMNSLSSVAAFGKGRKVVEPASPPIRHLQLDVAGVSVHCLAAGDRGRPWQVSETGTAQPGTFNLI